MATIYVDFTSNNGTITGTWTFTNASTSVTGVGGAATTELANGNYIRLSDGTQWYKVTARPDDNTITITPAFQQATHTDDLNATLKNTKTGTGIADAYCHINQATTDAVRSAGDIIKVRANQTHVYAGISLTFDEGGTVNSYITLKGCTVADDPFGDTSDVKPIIDFSLTASRCAASRSYWKFQNFEFIGGNSSSGNFYTSGAHKAKISNCVFRGASTRGLNAAYYSSIEISDCSFHSNGTSNITISKQGTAVLKNCIFNGGSGTARGLDLYSGTVFLYDCSFGVTTLHSTSDIFFAAYGGRIYGRNVILASTIEVTGLAGKGAVADSFIKIEDNEQTKLANRAWYWNGNIERGTAIIEGVTHWLKGTPNSSCGVEQALTLFEDLPLWLPASAKTITVSMRASGYGVTLPSNTECYIEVMYYNGATATRVPLASTEAFAANDTWTNFTVTITPNSEGPVYLSAYLKKYIASAFVYVNMTTLGAIT